jgi:hypothetical protein
LSQAAEQAVMILPAAVAALATLLTIQAKALLLGPTQ